jgi:hypothetical protein
MGIDKRVENLERLYGTPELRGQDEASETARRRQGQETLDEVQRRLAAIARPPRGGGCDLTPEEEEDALRHLYREVLGCEVGDDEYERRVALVEKYGAVFLAPLREQQDLLRRP